MIDLKTDLEVGRRPDVTEPVLMAAAIHLVSGMPATGVKPWGWLPAPQAEELADPAGWAARRLAEQRVVQNEAERIRRGQQKLARDLGLPRPAGSGSGKPIYQQEPKRSLDEMAQRLEQVMRREGFQRQWLDGNSEHYIRDADGGIGNKQIVLFANLIVGRQEDRPFDENWRIVTDYMQERAKNAAEK
jgi:hypothetical protein